MWNNATHSFHIGAWALWLAAAMLLALSTRNPFYLLLTIAISVLVNRGITRPSPNEMRNVQGSPSFVLRQGEFGMRNTTGDNAIQITELESDGHNREIRNPHSAIGTSAIRNPRALLLRAVIILAFAVALLKGLSYHIGETVLFSMPGSLPVIGGPVTAEGLAAAGLDGLSILTVLAVFTAFGAGADYYAMLRSVPPFMHQVALVTSIAITFVPQTVVRFGEIREAQALRGHRVRRISDLVPLVMPLLAGGMERSMNLAEAMESRGFSRASATERRVPPLVVQLGLTFGLAFVLVGSTLFGFAPDMPWLAWLLIASGLLLITVTLRAIGAGLKRSRYRRTIWRDRDTPLAVVSAGVIAMILTFKFIAPSLFSYDPFLRISMPHFDPVVGITILALLAPAVILWVSGAATARSSKLSTQDSL
jgi:energy-coupling factor transport system permease protein